MKWRFCIGLFQLLEFLFARALGADKFNLPATGGDVSDLDVQRVAPFVGVLSVHDIFQYRDRQVEESISYFQKKAMKVGSVSTWKNVALNLKDLSLWTEKILFFLLEKWECRKVLVFPSFSEHILVSQIMLRQKYHWSSCMALLQSRQLGQVSIS